MTTHRPRRDPLGDRVANSFLPEDLKRALPGLPRTAQSTARHLFDLLDATADRDGGPDQDTIEWLAEILWSARLDPALRARLIAYLGDRAPAIHGRCLWCLDPLPARIPGTAGRRALYCGRNHRKAASRWRHRTDVPSH